MRYIRILALLAIGTAVHVEGRVALAVNGTWTNAAGGNWSLDTNWAGGTVADSTDGTANFSTLDLTADAIVTVDVARTIGNMTFGDTAASNNWLVNSATVGDPAASVPLTLDVATGSPTITVNDGIASIAAKISGTVGFTKQGPGVLTLSNPAFATGTLPGQLLTDMNDYTGNTVVAAGILRIATTANQQPTMLGAATVNGTPGTPGGTNQVIVNSGATLQFTANSRVDNKEMHLGGTGVDGSTIGVAGQLGAVYVNASGTTNGTRIGHLTGTNPAIVLDGNTTVRIDGTGAATSASSVALFGRTNLGGFTLTKMGGGRLSWEVGGGGAITGAGATGTLHVVEGVVSSNQVNGFNSNLANVIVDAGTQIWGTNGGVFNANAANYTINGTMVVNARDGSSIDMSATVGALNGSGTIKANIFATQQTAEAHGPGLPLGAYNTLTIGHATIDSTFSGTITNVAPGPVQGDYSNNSVVDAADYVVWRNAAPNAVLPNDPTPGQVDDTDYQFWRERFGNTPEELPRGRLNINKAQANTLTLSGANTYNGLTQVNAGTLLVNGSHVGGSPDPFLLGPSYNVAAGATLGGTGTIKPADGQVTALDGGIIAPGAGGVGTLTLDGQTANSAMLEFAADGDSSGSALFDVGAAFASDKIALVNGAASDIVFNNNVLNFNVLAGAQDGDYTLFTANVPDAYSGLTLDGSNTITAGLAIGTGLDAGSLLKVVGNNIVLSAMLTAPPASGSLVLGTSTAIPEPTSLFLALMGAMAMASRRRNWQRGRCQL